MRLSIGIEDADDLIAVWSRHWHRSDRLRRIVEEAFVLLRFCLQDKAREIFCIDDKNSSHLLQSGKKRGII